MSLALLAVADGEHPKIALTTDFVTASSTLGTISSATDTPALGSVSISYKNATITGESTDATSPKSPPPGGSSQVGDKVTTVDVGCDVVTPKVGALVEVIVGDGGCIVVGKLLGDIDAVAVGTDEGTVEGLSVG
mmetsp:Transcript_8886/g.13263  ORF Transcript_8886/g.13263 Transcript_8886/m.13263 type:complete len:134 (+) Transcript_8886:236-637(+)